MKIRRALGFAALAYVITMVLGVIISTAAGIDMTDMTTTPPAWCWIVSSLAAVIFSGWMAYLYFRSPKVAKGSTQGLYFGLVTIGVGFILDIATLVPGYGWAPLAEYYSMPIFWVTLVLVVTTSVFMGKRAAK